MPCQWPRRELEILTCESYLHKSSVRREEPDISPSKVVWQEQSLLLFVKLAFGPLRSPRKLSGLGANLNGSLAQKSLSAKGLTNLATMLGWQESQAIDVVQTLYCNGQANPIWNLFGGN